MPAGKASPSPSWQRLQGLTLDDLKEKALRKAAGLPRKEATAGRISEARAAYTLEVMEERLDGPLPAGWRKRLLSSAAAAEAAPGRRMAPFHGGMARLSPGHSAAPGEWGFSATSRRPWSLTIENTSTPAGKAESIPELAEGSGGWTLALT